MTDELKAPILAAYEFVEKFVEKTRYIAGEEITIADFSFCTTLANLEVSITSLFIVYILNNKFMVSKQRKNVHYLLF